MSIPSKISAKTNPNRIDGIARIGGFMYPLFTTNLKKLTVAFQNEPFSYFVSLQSPCSSSPCQHKVWSEKNWISKFTFTSQGSIIIYHGGGGWRILEDHMIFRGKGGGISRRRQRLNGGDWRNRLPILKMSISGDHKDIEEPLTTLPPSLGSKL